MVYGFAEQAELGDLVTYVEMEQSIRRNFSGLDDLDPMKIFSRQFPRLKDCIKVTKYKKENYPEFRTTCQHTFENTSLCFLLK